MKTPYLTASLTACLLSMALAGGGSMPPITTSATSISSAAPAGGPMQNTVFYDQYIKRVTSVAEVYPDGQRATGAIVEFDTPIKNSSLTTNSFTVSGRTVTRIYANTSASKAASGQDGRFVIVELNPNDKAAPIFDPSGPILQPADIKVIQAKAVQTMSGQTYASSNKPIGYSRQVNPIVDDFQQFKFTDPQTGLPLTYNLYIPKNYDPNKKYPLVLFMHDLGGTNLNPFITLVQGLGAVSFASPEDQAKHPAFVLAPEVPVPLANDNSQTSEYADVIVRLIHSLEGKYGIDSNRLYTTGQSGGCMTSIALNIKYPDLFAASLLVAGQWDPSKVAPMAHNKLWIIVSQDDDKAFPGMNAITAEIKKNGGKVTSAVWDGTGSTSQLNAAAAALLKAGPDSNVHYASFKKGTVIPAGASTQGAAGHRNTWRIAYTIPAVRDWLFQQSK